MQLVEQHIITRRDPRWGAIDAACCLSKNLYNAANYPVRQEYIFQHRFIAYAELDKLMKHNPDYCALPRKVSQWVLKQVDHDWQAFFAARAAWEIHPETFQGRPKLPQYKHKTEGRNLLTYTVQAVGKKVFKKQGLIQPSQLDITIQTQQKSFDQVRIVPRKTHYVVEVVYTASVQPAAVDPERIAAIDIGLDNLATVTSNQPDFCPLLVNGRPLKAINQYYNKERARLQSYLKDDRKTSRRIDGITAKRNRRVNAYLHLASRRVIETLVQHHIGTLVIGKNDGWKRDINLGKCTNQNFVQIPHARFIEMLSYKAELVGIRVVLTEESYTSKCSFLDNEPIGKHEVYAGKRIQRGLFRASDGRLIHADVNGALNILRKVIPNAFGNGIGAAVVQPVRVTPHERFP
ncbi:MAG: IS200/IS605 family element transposase accessory protein TnpB [Chloroflexi bacterium]|nr:IS200/IS605 family element transposase accessory protein TnpB [Chloroflexota bacterium]